MEGYLDFGSFNPVAVKRTSDIGSVKKFRSASIDDQRDSEHEQKRQRRYFRLPS